MAEVRPFQGIRYNPEHVRLGGVLAPPYDVISPPLLEELYGRDLRNVARIDFGMSYAGDEPGSNDRYTRAAEFLSSWLDLGVLVRDSRPSLYITDHEFVHPDGDIRHRRGLLAVIPARPWDQSELRPHERTMRGPKDDRLALLRATHAQTSPVFGLWSGASDMAALLDAADSTPPILGGRTQGEMGSEKHLLWQIDDESTVESIRAALAASTLYVADGHHRYETAVAYAAERRAAEPDAQAGAPFESCLVYLAASDDPGLTILPTHRLVRSGRGIAFSLDDLWARLDDSWDEDPAPSVEAALDAAATSRATHHAFAVVASDGVAVLKRPRAAGGSPREQLDVTVLEREILTPAGVSAESIAGGALGYTRSPHDLAAAVQQGDAILGFGVQPVAVDEVLAVADAGETMPQKSTYFYPKVPTGLVLYPV
jgi:uncharacterized protein (DUF1015 family)